MQVESIKNLNIQSFDYDVHYVHEITVSHIFDMRSVWRPSFKR